MLSTHIGDELDCVVTGLASFGVFVQSLKFGIEGLIQLADLGLDVWKYNSKTQSIIGQRSGHSIHLGQPIKVRIISVNIPARQLNLAAVELLAGTRKHVTTNKASEKSKKRRTVKRPGRSRKEKSQIRTRRKKK